MADSIFPGRRIARVTRPVILPQKEKRPEPQGLKFPVTVQASGVTRGPQWCSTCSRVIGEKDGICPICGGADIESWRQVLLKRAKDMGLGTALLVPEPENPVDPEAVAVYIRFPKGMREHVGYIPAKKRTEDQITASEILKEIKSERKLWVLCQVVGGPMEGRSELSYGLKLTIDDRPPGA